jgi:hypothetical protein
MMSPLLAKALPARGVDLWRLLSVHDRMAWRVKYVFGAKASPLMTDPAAISALDCSGYARVQLAHQGILSPDGSSQELDFIRSAGARVVNYENVLRYAVKDHDRLFLAGWAPSASEAGHIWFVLAGQTLECCHRLGGVGSQDAHRYAHHLGIRCFELPVDKSAGPSN